MPLFHSNSSARMPHFCPVLAEVGCHGARTATVPGRVSGHDFPARPGIPPASGFVSGHDFTACGKSTPRQGSCIRARPWSCRNWRRLNPALAAEGRIPGPQIFFRKPFSRAAYVTKKSGALAPARSGRAKSATTVESPDFRPGAFNHGAIFRGLNRLFEAGA